MVCEGWRRRLLLRRHLAVLAFLPGQGRMGAFNHHAAIAKFRGRYYVAWSNGIRNEEDERQRTLISWSDDAVDWSAPVCVCGNEDGIAHNCMGLLAEDDRLVLLNMKESIEHDATLPGMRRIEPGSKELSAMVSSDGTSWETAFTYGDHMKMFLEAPRLTADGALLCVAVTNQGPVMLRWASDDVCQEPESILIPEPRGTSFPYGEGTWYQVDDGTIMVFWRDEGMSCRVWVNYSDDGGRTFSEPVVSDIPDSMSRLYAGRLADGRYYLCNNASATLLNRRNLMLMISETGYEFTSVHMLANDPTSQRFFWFAQRGRLSVSVLPCRGR